MVSYSMFQNAAEVREIPSSKEYKVYINGQEIPVYACRISKYPFNTWWPGHQRQINQTELVSFVNLVSDEEVKVEVEPLTKVAYQRVMVKPYFKGVETERVGDKVVFTLKENGGYVFELDDYHGLLYIFNNKPILCENPENVTYYFGKGVHYAGKIILKSNESIYIDKDAFVYGCIYANKAENLHIYGNGIFDDGVEERINANCYTMYPNGNVKFFDCNNIKIEGVGFTNSAIWCVNIFHCFDVDIDGIKAFGQWRYNTDGIDIVNSQRITIRNSFIHSFDDAITVKGIDDYADTSNTDILVENCVLWCDWGKTCEIGLETMCREYDNITFRNCDILRAGNTALDIQNGDCAEVHDILFENIRIEFDGCYTPYVLQLSDDDKYNMQDQLEVAEIVSFGNPRFREMDMYAGLCLPDFSIGLKKGDKEYASIRDITVRDITVYADDRVMREKGEKGMVIKVVNGIQTSNFKNINVENITLNGKRLKADEITIKLDGVDKKALTVK